jgi:anhydro-N-acetylmuramic acid kinase
MKLRVIGLMSGTSLDGIDAALVEIDGVTSADLSWKLIEFVSVPYTAEQRKLIHDAMVRGDAAALCEIHALIGEWFATAALAVCERARVVAVDVDVIGSHGQTVWHRPPSKGARGATLQLGDAATIAERTGVPVVSDFRSRDVAAGGEGAPLVAWVDRALFSVQGRRRVLQNIGGMGNLTWLPAREDDQPLLAFDTGPGNALIDAAVEIATRGVQTYDDGGARAARGVPDMELVEDLLMHPFFKQPPPRSTGREVFGRPFVEQLVRSMNLVTEADWDNFIATLTSFTAHSIARSCRDWLRERGFDEMIVTGGGARNRTMMRMIQELLEPVPVLPGDTLGIDADAKEALAFAAFAWAHVHRIAANVPEATGAEGPRVLGSFTPGSAERTPLEFATPI